MGSEVELQTLEQAELCPCLSLAYCDGRGPSVRLLIAQL